MLVPAMLVSLLSGLVIALSGVLVTAAAATGASADHRQPDSQQARANLSKQDLEFQKYKHFLLTTTNNNNNNNNNKLKSSQQLCGLISEIASRTCSITRTTATLGMRILMTS